MSGELEAEALGRLLVRRPWVEHAALPGRTNHLRAGVLVPLRWRDGVSCTLTLRPGKLRRHGGEVSFPGGRREPEDVSLEATALREAREEIGLTAAHVLGRLSSMPVYTSDFRLEPFVAQVPSDAVWTPDPVEVEQVLELDIDQVLEGGFVESVRIDVSRGTFQMPVFRPQGWVTFGATALTLVELLGVMAELRGIRSPELIEGPLPWEDVLASGAAAGGGETWAP